MSRTPKTMVVTAQHFRARARAPDAHCRNRFNQNRPSGMLFYLDNRRGLIIVQLTPIFLDRVVDPNGNFYWSVHAYISSCICTSDYSHFYKFNSSLELTSCLVNERIAKSQESQPAWKFRAAEVKYTDCAADLVSTTIQRRDLPPNPEHSP